MARTNGGSQTFAAWTPGTPLTFTLGFTTTVGRLLALLVIDFDQNLEYTVTGGATWTERLDSNDSTNGVGAMSWFTGICTSAVSSITLDATDNGTGSGGRFVLIEFSGMPDPVTLAGTATAYTAASGSPTCGPVSPTQAGSVLLAGGIGGGGADLVADGSWTTELDTAEIQVAYREVAAGSYSWSPTVSPADDSHLTVVGIEGAGGGGSPTSARFRNLRVRAS